MATRLRISAYQHPNNPPRHASWTNGGTNPTLQLISDEAVVGTTTYNYTEPTATMTVGDYHIVTLLSRPLAAQTLGGTVKGQIKARENGTVADHMAQILIQVLDASLSTKAVVLPLHASALANEFGTTDTNRFFPPVPNTALTPYTCAEGDILAVELGYRSLNIIAGTQISTLTVGGTVATDLPEDQTTTTIGPLPWIELSQDLVYAPPTAVLYGALPVMGTEYIPGTIATTGQLWPRGF